MKRFRFLFPSLPDRQEFSRHVDDLFQSGWLSNRAAKVQSLERALSESLGIDHVVCVSSACLGLLVLIRALELPEGSRLLMPAFNFPATAEAVLWNRLLPEYVEIEPNALTLDPVYAEKYCTAESAAIMPVHSFGNLAVTESIASLAGRKGLTIIYDGASALGSLLRSKPIAAMGAATVISLHATKILPAGEGGAILTRDGRLAEACRKLINFGLDDSQSVSRFGINAKMSEFNAAFALAGLKNLDANVERRIDLAHTYLELLQAVPWLTPHVLPGSVLQLFPISISKEYPAAIREKLRRLWSELGIETRCYYDPPLHTMPAFRPGNPIHLPVTEEICARVICLPFHTYLSPNDLVEIVSRIGQAGAPAYV